MNSSAPTVNQWSLLNQADAEAQFEHYVYYDKENDWIALADQSVRDPLDPSSADDGLLIWNGLPGIWARGVNGAMHVTISVIDQDHNLERVTITVETAQTMERVSDGPVMPEFIRFGPFRYVRARAPH